MDTTWVGIDVSKAKVTVCVGSKGAAEDVSQPSELKGLVRRLGGTSTVQVVMESTGGYERPLQRALAAAAIPCTVLNPARARYFMRSLGRHAKSDPIDAGLLALYGERLRPKPTSPPALQVDELSELVQRRQQLVRMRTAEVSHGEHARVRVVKRSLNRLAEVLAQQIAELDAAIAAHLESHPELREKSRRMRTVKGVGPAVAAGLLSHVPELGTLSKAEVAAIAGVAPYIVESGTYKGQRRIRGGRPEARRLLYMGALVAARHNPVLRALYSRLTERGKPRKVALIAIARKLIIMLNAMLRHGTDWSPHEAPA